MKKKKQRISEIPYKKKQRIRVLLRNPKYLKDIKELEAIYPDKRKPYIKNLIEVSPGIAFYPYNIKYFELCRKYKVDSLPCKEPTNWNDYFYLEHSIPLEKSAQLKNNIDISVIVRGFNDAAWKRDIEKNTFEPDMSQHLREGKYLTVEIDLTWKKKDIMGRISGIIDFYSNYINKPKSRPKVTVLDPFLVYDMYHTQGLNFSEISRSLSGIKGNPSTNARLMAYYKQVKRAYNKAIEMIKQIEKDIKN